MDKGAECYRRFRENGDESGLVELIREYKDGLIFFLSGIVGDLRAAEELAEDCFVLLGTKKPKDKGRGSFKTWLYAIGRNLALDWLRKQKRTRTVSLEDAPELTDGEAELERAYLREERKIALRRAMGRLKPDCRQVLWLLYFEDMRHKEAAAVMGKTVHGTETLAYRARAALKKELEREGITDEDL